MPGTTTGQDIELIIEKGNGGGGGNTPPAGGNGGGDDGKRGRKGQPSAAKYYAGVAIAIVAILMFFMALASAFLIRKGTGGWVPVHIPGLLWVNTAILLASSATLEMARKRLAKSDAHGFRRLWQVTTILGVLFLVGPTGGVANPGWAGHLPGHESCQQFLLYFHRSARVAPAWRCLRLALRGVAEF